MKQVLIIVHQATSTPGLIGQVLREQGYQLDIRCPGIGHALPDTLDHHCATIVFGGPMSANDDQTLPFIRTELDWIPTALESGKPYLGICLGAQLLARVLGAKVAPHPDDIMEIGYRPIQPTPAGEAEFGRLQSVYHWHREGFEIPHGAVRLAVGDPFENQAYRYGDSAYGVQFHPEMTREMMERWTTVAADHLKRPEAQPVSEQWIQHERHGLTVERWLRQFLPHWLGRDQRLERSAA